MACCMQMWPLFFVKTYDLFCLFSVKLSRICPCLLKYNYNACIIFDCSCCSVDLMVGFNRQEGGLALSVDFFAYSLFTGVKPTTVTADHAESSAYDTCTTENPESAATCTQTMIDYYGLDDAPDNTERATRLSYMYG